MTIRTVSVYYNEFWAIFWNLHGLVWQGCPQAMRSTLRDRHTLADLGMYRSKRDDAWETGDRNEVGWFYVRQIYYLNKILVYEWPACTFLLRRKRPTRSIARWTKTLKVLNDTEYSANSFFLVRQVGTVKVCIFCVFCLFMRFYDFQIVSGPALI